MLAENTDGLNYDGLNQVLRIVRMKHKLSALTTFGNAREVREAADPAAREAAMRDLFIYALNGSAFWYSEDMFLEAVKMVREAEAASAGDVILSGMSPAVPPRTPYSGTPERKGGGAGDITGRDAGYGGYSAAAARELFADAGEPGGTDIGRGSYAAGIRAAVPDDDEDALAYADLMEDLHIPPDPRKKQQ